MKYEVGQKVKIKSLDWYNENKDEFGQVECGQWNFTKLYTPYCGKVMTIRSIYEDDECYKMVNSDHHWTDEMIEGLVEKEVSYATESEWLKHEISLPEGYQFKDENGNVISASKIVLEKKKKEYPKTYTECCEMLNIDSGCLLASYDIGLWKDELFSSLQKLLICRDAYWKIAGEEMGLEKPWKPDWDNLSTNHEFIKINKGCFTYSSRVLVFPTEEVRDAFKGNFDPDIEICKELL